MLGPLEPVNCYMMAKLADPIRLPYERAVQGLAGHVWRGEGSPWTPVDVAVLMDVRTALGSVQVEYGIVTRAELVERMTTSIGKSPAGWLIAELPKKLPNVAVFAACHHRFASEVFGERYDIEQILDAWEQSLNDAGQAISQLSEGMADLDPKGMTE